MGQKELEKVLKSAIQSIENEEIRALIQRMVVHSSKPTWEESGQRAQENGQPSLEKQEHSDQNSQQF